MANGYSLDRAERSLLGADDQTIFIQPDCSGCERQCAVEAKLIMNNVGVELDEGGELSYAASEVLAPVVSTVSGSDFNDRERLSNEGLVALGPMNVVVEGNEFQTFKKFVEVRLAGKKNERGCVLRTVVAESM